jgi:hypothetical protein
MEEKQSYKRTPKAVFQSPPEPINFGNKSTAPASYSQKKTAADEKTGQ